MNRKEYKAAIRSLLNKPTPDLTLTDRELEVRIAQRRVWLAKQLWNFCKDRLKTYTTYVLGVGSDPAYKDLPSDFITDLSATIDGHPAFRIDISDYAALDENYFYTPTATNPVYFVKGNQIAFSPPSLGSIATLFYVAKPTEFSDDTTDESSLDLGIPEEYQDLVVQKVCEDLSSRAGVEYKPSGGTVEEKILTLLGKKKEDVKK